MAKANKTTKLLLYLLLKSGQAIIDYATFFHDLRRWRGLYSMGGSARVQEFKRLQKISTAKAALRSLQKSKFITARKIGKKLIIELTAKGVAATLSEQLRQESLLPGGTYTMVIFDIPETERGVRRHFRWLLRQGEFIKLQQSVWISKHNVQNTITKFIKKLKLENWVNVGLVSNLFTTTKTKL